MPKDKCNLCNKQLLNSEIVWRVMDGDKINYYCQNCYAKLRPYYDEFNKPTHYHKHKIDTIQFLQEGFSPEVFKGFAIGSIVKYVHRYEYKNGLEDLIKAEDYIKRLIEIHKKKTTD